MEIHQVANFDEEGLRELIGQFQKVQTKYRDELFELGQRMEFLNFAIPKNESIVHEILRELEKKQIELDNIKKTKKEQ